MCCVVQRGQEGQQVSKAGVLLETWMVVSDQDLQGWALHFCGLVLNFINWCSANNSLGFLLREGKKYQPGT